MSLNDHHLKLTQQLTLKLTNMIMVFQTFQVDQHDDDESMNGSPSVHQASSIKDSYESSYYSCNWEFGAMWFKLEIIYQVFFACM